MFAFDKNLKETLGGAIDALVDLATLGEYGYEPVPDRPDCLPTCKPVLCAGAPKPIRRIRTSSLPARMP